MILIMTVVTGSAAGFQRSRFLTYLVDRLHERQRQPRLWINVRLSLYGFLPTRTCKFSANNGNVLSSEFSL